MTFRNLSFSLAVLRSASSSGFVKDAGALTRMAVGAGRYVINQAVKHQGVLAPVALGGAALGTGAAVKHSINKTRSNMIGFDPNVVAAKREMGGE
jgi:hypothetical protein